MTARLEFWRPESAAAFPWLRAVVTRRHGGTSGGAFASLNLGRSTGDDVACVDANRSRVLAALGLDQVHLLHQVHGTEVFDVPGPRPQEGDGLRTRTPGVAIGIGVADCVPAFVWDPAHRTIAVVHAGWRGTASGILTRTLRQFVAAGSRPADLHVALGPSIGRCCYVVGTDVAARFPAAAVEASSAGCRLDLRRANRLQAEELGVPSDRIESTPPCTSCEPAAFFSHRREQGRTGRMWAIAWIATGS